MTQSEPIAIIVDRRSTMYDPNAVDMFLTVYGDFMPVAQQQPGCRVR